MMFCLGLTVGVAFGVMLGAWIRAAQTGEVYAEGFVAGVKTARAAQSREQVR